MIRIPDVARFALAAALLMLAAGRAAAADCPEGQVERADGACSSAPARSDEAGERAAREAAAARAAQAERAAQAAAARAAAERAERAFSLERQGYSASPRQVPVGAVPARPTLARPTMGYARPDAQPLVPVRMFLRSRDIPPAGVGAYGIVALRGLPTPASVERLKRVCQSFVKYLPRSESLPSSVTIEQKMVTAWPLDDPASPRAQADDCDYLTAHYDLYGGLSAIQDAAGQGADVRGRGPFLIGWSPSSSRGVRDKIVLVYDMSRYESQDSFDQAFIWWQQKVVSDPRLWTSGWSAEQVRLSIRDFFDQYATSALEAIKLFGGPAR